MRPQTQRLLIATGLAAIGVGVFSQPFAVAQFSGVAPTSPTIIAYPPDGGLEAVIPGRVDTNITNEWVAVAGGPAGERLEVDIPNPISLNTQAQALLAGQRNCIYTAAGRLVVTPDGGVFHIAAGPSGGNFKAHGFGNNVDFVSCWPHTGAGPFPNCLLGDGGVGFDLHNHEVADVDFTTSIAWKMDCITCVHSGAPAQDNAMVTGVLSICSPP